MATERRLQAIEFGLWVATVATIVVVLGGGVGYGLGGSLVGAKYALFVVGFLLFGVGTLAIQPPKPGGSRRWFSIENDEQTRLDAAIQRLPPLDEQPLPQERRIGNGAKLFVASLVVLGVSALLEFGFGVGG